MAGNGISVGWNDANTTFSGNIIDSTGSTTATLLKAGQGGLMLTGVNTYAGLTTVAGGTLAAANPSSLPGYGTSSISVAGGATLAVQSGDGTTGFSSSQIDSILANTNWASAYTSSSNVPFLGIDTTNGDFTYGTNITQNIGLSKFGPHTLYLTGANTYPGGTTINAGVLNINGDTALGAASGAIAFTGNSTLQAGNEGIVVNSARTVTINSGVTGTIDTASYNNFTIAAPIGGTGNLAKIGAGTLTLSASSVNSYSGKTYLQGGAIAVNTSLQGLYEGVVSVQNSAWDTTDPIPQTSIQPVARWGASTQTSANAATAVYPSWPNNTTIGYTGYIDNTSNQPLVYTFGKNFDDNASVVVDGTTIISNTTWNQNVTGQITLAPGLHTVSLRFGQGTGGAGPNTAHYDNYGISYNTAGNTNTGGNWYQMGATDPSGDTQFYAAVAGMPNSQVVMSSNTTLDLSAAGVGVAGVGSLADAAGSPTGALVLLGSNTLVTGLDNTNTSFSGTISGNGSLVKQGTGMFILAGSNTYTGTTSVVAGILDATGTAALPGYALAGTVGVMGGATLAVQANVNGTSGWNSSQIDTLWGNASWASSTAALGIDTTQGDFTYGTNITEAFGLTKLGANALILTGANLPRADDRQRRYFADRQRRQRRIAQRHQRRGLGRQHHAGLQSRRHADYRSAYQRGRQSLSDRFGNDDFDRFEHLHRRHDRQQRHSANWQWRQRGIDRQHQRRGHQQWGRVDLQPQRRDESRRCRQRGRQPFPHRRRHVDGEQHQQHLRRGHDCQQRHAHGRRQRPGQWPRHRLAQRHVGRGRHDGPGWVVL